MGLNSKRSLFTSITSATALAATTLIAVLNPTQARAQVAYAIGNGGTSLVRFNVTNPTAATVVATFNGPGFLDAIDFRPSDGQLYGYLNSTHTLYTVNTTTGALTTVSTGSATSTNTSLLGMDFNPTGNLVRIVTNAGDNVVYNTAAPGTAPTIATPLAYGSGNVSPHVIENAYTNDINGAGSTQQYGIDYQANTLVTIANNAGTLATVGSLGLTIEPNTGYVGFDIYSTFANNVTSNFAYGVFDTTAGNAPGLYSINLATGAATSIGAVGNGTIKQVYSLAITPQVAAPEPGSLPLIAVGVLPMVGLVLRRRQQR